MLVRPDALTLTVTTLIPSSFDRFDQATAFNQDVSAWNVALVTASPNCQDFCAGGAGFTAAAQLPVFPGGPPPTCAGTGLGCSPP